jgi:hypothetical protein
MNIELKITCTAAILTPFLKSVLKNFMASRPFIMTSIANIVFIIISDGIETSDNKIIAIKDMEENKREFCNDTLPVTNWALSHTVNEPNRI